MSCRLYGYPWPSLATSPYRSSPPAGLQGYIPYPHIATVCMFELVVLLLLGYMWGPSLMSSSLLLQQCPACLVCLTWIVFVMGGRWPYSWCFVGCCRQDLFNIARYKIYICKYWFYIYIYIYIYIKLLRTNIDLLSERQRREITREIHGVWSIFKTSNLNTDGF